MKNKKLEPIAIVGIGAIMPGALNKDEFWTNIQEGKNCITEIPKSYWDYNLFYSPDHKAEDKTYSKIGGFIPQSFKFNSIKYRIPPQIAKQMDTVQHLAIETTRMALEDAGYDKKAYDHNRTAVIIGNSMGGMKNEMSNTRLNRPFLYEILKNTPTYKHLAPADAQKMIDEMDEGVREHFTPINEDSMPGELANVIPGRVANVFDLHGTNFAVDAACATSLAAIDQAVNGLRMGNFDMAIAGGVDQMMSPSAFIKFCKIGALSETGSYPFDARANGFVMAEGAGMVILKRLSDAVKDGDRIYAVIRAVGASSDGKGKGITAPNPKGQKLAVEKAFEQVDYNPGEVGLLEAHGTGTRVGDATELNALNEIFAPYAKPGTIGLGSVKSQIGHAKAAAGIAALIKTSLALYNKVLPPSINFETPNPIVDWATCPFRVITKTQEWPAGKIRRANVSAFGFGGTNFHVAMEEMNDSLIQPAQPEVCAAGATPTKQEQVNMTSSNSYTLHVPGEKIQGDVLTFSAPTKQELSDILDKAVMAIQYDPAYLPSISYKNHIAKPQRFAVTINVETPEKLKEKIEFFKKISATQDVWEKESLYLRMKGIYPFTPTEIKPKVCFMFPGQGSQYVDMMKDLAAKYKVVQDTFDEADRLLTHIIGQTLTETLWSKPGESKEQIAQREAAIKKTEMTQPAVLTADIAMMRLLSSFGIKPDVVMGHSLGEYAAAVAAGIFDFENGLKAVCTRGKVMSEIKVEDNGKMASIAAPVERVEPELARINGYVAVANKNCPTQTVIAGASKSIDDAIKMFNDMGIQAVQIPVSHAFHSAIVRPAMPQYRAFLDTLTFHAPTMPITTNVTAEFYPSDPEKIKDLMVTQISHSVEWIKQLKTTYDSGVRLFVECGPKRVLSALAANTLSDKKDIKVLASNHPKKGGISEFNDLFANLISSGIHLDWAGTDMYGNHSTFNPAFVNWVTGTATPVEKELGASSCTASCAAAAPALAEAKNCCDKDIVISGIAAGGPGSWDRIFRDGVLDEILSGRNLIEPVSAEIQQKQIDKHVEFVIKSKDGNHRFERLTSPSQAIKLAARGGAFDAEKEFGLPAKWVRSMDRSFQLAIAAGILALKDAGIPLVLYYKPTSTGGYLPDRWGLPADMIDDTGVIFTSAFPVANSMMGDLSKRVAGLLNNKTAKEVRAFCDKFIAQITDPALKAEIEAWYNENFKDKEVEPMAFTSEFILKTIIIAHSHFCQWIRARGPATSMSAACASTAQAIAVAQDWIKLGRAKRVIVISADDITNDNVSEWILTAFLASGAATTEADVTKAALPFDRRRNGMIVGMGAVSLVVEEAGEVAKRGMKPLAKVLATEIRNSGFHVTRLDVGHVAQVMNDLVSEGERKSGVSRADIAKQLVFISHETYTPARGGSASAEAYALKSTFGADVSKVIVSNTKGFTGHSMGAGLEDAIAVHCLNTGLVPPIANFKEADPELEGITLSKGGHYNFKYALRLAAGFGSQLGMTLLEKVWDVNEPRIIDAARHDAWLKEISGQQNPVLEVVQNTLRVKDNYKHGVKPSLVMEGSQAFVDKVKTMHHTAPVQAAAPAVETAPAAAPAPVAQVAPKAAVSLNEEDVKKNILNIVSEKTGYPQDMLDLDLDMEADLGIDTVKQAELFAIMRETYHIAKQEGVQLKDYPTIRSIIKYAMANANTENGAAPVQAAAPVAQVAPAVKTVAAPVAQPAPAAEVAPVAKPAQAAPSLNEEDVTKNVRAIIAEKTGYPEDMLDLDLDMEADLGIDTVKQAELFAIMRETYHIAKQEGVQLKDYPTIRSIIKYAMTNANTADGAAQAAPAQAAAPAAQVAPAVETVVAPAPVAQVAPVAAPAAQPAPKAAAGKLDPAQVSDEIVAMVAEKTGYPKDMLDLDLDMEADLGIDTVKQAELFAAMREHYGIAQQEGIQLKDYPTIRHCINFVLNSVNNAAAPAAQPAAAPAAQVAPAVETVAAPAPAAQPAPAEEMPAQVAKPAFVSKPTAEHIGKPADDALTTNPTAPIERHESLAERPEAPGYKGEHCHEKKLRYVTMVADAPLTERENRRLSKDRTVLIFADNSALIKAYQEEFKELGVKTHVFTTLKTRSKNTTIVNWESYEETEKQLKEYAAEDPNIQGIVYLLGATVKKFDKKVSPHNELTKYVMPLFIALRVFEKGLSNRTDADTFFAVNTKIDGNFGYTTKDEFNPIVGALTGGTTCYRKDVYERTGAISKLMDFEPETTPDEMAQTTMDEVLHGDMRLMIGTRQKVRSTILSVPMRLDRSVKHFDLAGKTIIFTGSGRGIGAMLAQKIAAQYHSKIIILDIIEIQEKTPVWATMNEAELAALKKQMWEEMRADHTQKATPVMLERAFGRVKDSVTLYNNMQKLRDLGSEVEYYHCDVMNSSMMKEVCTKIKAKNSRVDGLIHFAGLERSKLIYDKDPMEYYRIFDVKATSFASFLANNVVKDKGFFAFASSIAGKYGNLGQSDYASANDYLAKSALSLSNQGYRAISIAMSAYKNVGMGVRAGVETFLRSNGVDFVDPEDGMQIFLDEIVYGRVPEIVLTGSLGRLDWDHQLLFEMDEIGADQKFGSDSSNNGSDDGSQNGGGQTPAAEPAAAKDATHFLGNVQKMEAGHELRGEKEFNLKADPYLADHAIEGTPYVPGVMGIETFMETANALMGKAPQGLEDVHFFLPIKLLRNRPQAVRIIGTSDGTQATMEIESDFINSKGVKMGNTRRHFTAKTLNAFTSTWDEVKNEIHLDVNAAPVVTKEEIYKKYFHGPSFQVLGGILRVNEKESLAVYHTTPKPQWPEAKTLLANPMLIEAAFQCCGFQDMSVANKMTLPDGIKEVAVFKREVPPQTLYLYGVNKGLTADGKTLHDAYVFDEKGNVWVEIHGYQAIGQ
ncbi:SDR family NAD(P)-dependent oxidoreductase [Candidatus Avelusimicrobium faecicola]|uniref:SDR family NAD(P)-dependent oxidoreductase n=1 Tax=Candidatus Avelusimicrobium faecicola TaxID=3416205 RepID=UPI003C84D8B1|nr:SDR family NAD(P)-dependent oxidoreductase [Spirochaetota bacterium]